MQLSNKAFQGNTETLVNLLHKQGYTEASREGVLAHTLAFIGNYVGKDSYVMIGDDKHQPIIWPIVVGETAAGKGTSSGAIRRAFKAFDPIYMRSNLVAGLSSGEGIIDHLSPEKDVETGNEVYPDPRLIVIEEEFTSVLRKSKRDSSILSQILQSAWDGKPLGSLNRKQNSYSAYEHHVTVVGHVTPRGLESELSSADFHNGFVNRLTFIRVNVQPAVAIPKGMTEDELNAATGLLQSIFRTAHKGEYRLTDKAQQAWIEYGPRFRVSGDSKASEALGRTRPQILRLALIYAIIDESHVIDVRHISAAVAVVSYSMSTVHELFGDVEARRNKKLVERLGADGPMTEREVRRIGFGGKSSVPEAYDWFKSLVEAGIVVEVPSERKTVVWGLSEAMTDGRAA